MSYQSSIIKRKRVARSVVGDVWDDMDAIRDWIVKTSGGKTESEQCQAQAEAATAQMQTYRLDLAANWHPTGYYSPDQVKQLVGQGQAALQRASDTVERAMAEMPDRDYDGGSYGNMDALLLKKSEIQKKMADSLTYIQAIRDADQQGIEVIDSPGLRAWVMDAMRVAENSTWAASFTSCMTPWWLNALGFVVAALRVLRDLAIAIVGLVIAVGQAILKIPDAAATFMYWAKWALLLGGGYYLAVQADLVDDHLNIKGKTPW